MADQYREPRPADQPLATERPGASDDRPHLLSCDIVMKGGITSGVVYPEAVVQLAKRYRFCGIGGTSAGAIAAAALAAAEYGRDSGGMEKLARIPCEFTSKVNGEPFIQSLFQPEAETRALFQVALAFQHGLLRGVGTLLRRFWRFPAAAFLLTALAAWFGWRGEARWTVVIVALAISPWILVLGSVRDLFKAFGALAGNCFGLCRLGPRDDGTDPLTVWLHKTIQNLAGLTEKDDPLTFADLWGVPRPAGADPARRASRLEQLSGNPRFRKIDLQIVTTNLTHGRPISLPLLKDLWKDDYSDGGLVFDEEEFRDFFPDEVVDHMVKHRRPMDAKAQAAIQMQGPDRKLHRFAFSGELPILVAARMSLSFPVLISAVPLWTIHYQQAGKPARVRRLLFSDGGISSNFPIHFFDTPLPTRPTFAINLAGFEDDEKPILDNPLECVRPPDEANARRTVESWKQPKSMMDFFVAIKDAMQNWRDNSQARMPGFRERVIHIKLASGEGGLNLAMDTRTIERLSARGRHAGETLKVLFSGCEDVPHRTEHWNNHRYARFRTYMASMERHMRDLRIGYRKAPDAVSIPYLERILQGSTRGPFKLEESELEVALETLRRCLESIPGAVSLDQTAPRPKATLRNMPPV